MAVGDAVFVEPRTAYRHRRVVTSEQNMCGCRAGNARRQGVPAGSVEPAFDAVIFMGIETDDLPDTEAHGQGRTQQRRHGRSQIVIAGQVQDGPRKHTAHQTRKALVAGAGGVVVGEVARRFIRRAPAPWSLRRGANTRTGTR